MSRWFESIPRNHKIKKKGVSIQTDNAINVASIVTALQGAVSASDIVTLMGTIVTAGMSFVLVWFGGRKVVSSFRAALTKGKLKL